MEAIIPTAMYQNRDIFADPAFDVSGWPWMAPTTLLLLDGFKGDRAGAGVVLVITVVVVGADTAPGNDTSGNNMEAGGVDE